jgi:putative membrane protein
MTPADVAGAQDYAVAAMDSDGFEIVTGHLALQRTQNSEVRAYAQGMVEHHGLTSDRLLAAARKAGVAPPPAPLSRPKLAAFDVLQAQVGFAFDRAYIDAQIASHEQALALHSGYAQAGREPRLRRTAAQAVPVVNEHLSEARRLQRRLAAGL